MKFKKAEYAVIMGGVKKSPYVEKRFGYIFQIDGVDFGICQEFKKHWQVTDLKTGLCVTSGRTRKVAVEQITEIICKKIRKCWDQDGTKKYIQMVEGKEERV